MVTLNVYNESGQVTGQVEFDETVLGQKVRHRLLQQVVLGYLANRRSGTASTKTKGERHGSGKKPWRQKGTGRARVGMRRSPLWRKGGRTFGPRPRDFSQTLPRQMRREALKSALLSKFRDDEVTVIEPLAFSAPKTKRMAGLLQALKLDGREVLFALAKADPLFWKFSRNLPRVGVTTTSEMNAHAVLRCTRLVFTRPAVEQLGKVVARG